MPISKRDKLNLERFGCAFRETTGVFLIDWKGMRAAQALSADIFAFLTLFRTNSGPIVLLALEISPVRPRPHYFYFPFDLKSEVHKKYLYRLTSTGEIRLSLLDGKRFCKRTHQLTPYLRFRASEIYAEALHAYESVERDKYDFNSGLQIVERFVRIPQLMNRLILEDTLREVSNKIEEEIKSVPNENKELARKIVQMAAQAFGPYYQNNRKEFLETLSAASLGVTCVIDFHRMFADNPEGLTKFLIDAFAVMSHQELNALGQLAAFVAGILGLEKDGLHSFRRGCNRRWELAGIAPAVIRQQMGHTSATMTALYSGEIPVEDVSAEFSKKFGNKIVVLEKMENEAAA
jgi:hypothetical protein